MKQQPLSILWISVRADLSGGPRHLQVLLSEFQQADFLKQFGVPRVFVAAPAGEHLSPIFQREATGFFPLPHRRFSPWRLWRLSQFVRQHQIQVIHSHGRGAGWYSRLLGWLTKRPVVHSFHGAHAADSVVEKIKQLIDRGLRPLTRAFVSVSEDEVKAALKNHMASADRVRVIRNGVSVPDSFRPTPPAQPWILGSLSRKDPIKDASGLARLFRRFQQESAEIPALLRIAGDGIPEMLAAENSSTLQALGPVNAVEFLQSIHLFISNSRSEGMPLAALEAMAQGVPCLLSDVPGHRLLIEKGAARGFQQGHEMEFTCRLQELLRNSQTREDLARAGYEFVRREASAEKMAHELMRFYREILPTSLH